MAEDEHNNNETVFHRTIFYLKIDFKFSILIQELENKLFVG